MAAFVCINFVLAFAIKGNQFSPKAGLMRHHSEAGITERHLKFSKKRHRRQLREPQQIAAQVGWHGDVKLERQGHHNQQHDLTNEYNAEFVEGGLKEATKEMLVRLALHDLSSQGSFHAGEAKVRSQWKMMLNYQSRWRRLPAKIQTAISRFLLAHRQSGQDFPYSALELQNEVQQVFQTDFQEILHDATLRNRARKSRLRTIHGQSILPGLAQQQVFDPRGLGGSLQQKSGCGRPGAWCSHAGSILDYMDCDDDGQIDLACTDIDGRRGTILSSQGCFPVWPSAPLESCPQLFQPGFRPPSLPGPPGPPGPPGLLGPLGSPGPPGGDSPIQQGQQGSAGPTGNVGLPGNQGILGTSGLDGMTGLRGLPSSRGSYPAELPSVKALKSAKRSMEMSTCTGDGTWLVGPRLPVIPDDYITASSYSNNNSDGDASTCGLGKMWRSRLDNVGTSPWCPLDATGTAGDWIQWDFNQTVTIVMVTTAGFQNMMVSHYSIVYSLTANDGDWKVGGDGDYFIFDSADDDNFDPETPVNQMVQPAIVARYIRILPKACKVKCALRADFLSCADTAATATATDAFKGSALGLSSIASLTLTVVMLGLKPSV